MRDNELDVPDAIWLFMADHPLGDEHWSWHDDPSDNDPADIRYIRADLHEQRIAELEAALEVATNTANLHIRAASRWRPKEDEYQPDYAAVYTPQDFVDGVMEMENE